MHLLEQLRFAQGKPPVADYDDGGTTSDVINMKNFNKGCFVIQKGVGTTGTGVVTVLACDDTTPSNTTAVPFRYVEISAADVVGTITEATSSGYTITAGSNIMVVIEVDAVELAKTGYGYVQLSLTESENAAVLAGILFIGAEPRYEVGSGDATVTS